MQAVKSAGQIIDLFLKLGPCWKKLVAAGEPYSAEFMSISTELQKGTRTLQALCSEAKSKKELGIVAKVGDLSAWSGNHGSLYCRDLVLPQSQLAENVGSNRR